MKLLLTAVCFIVTSLPTPLLVLDKNLKKPVKPAEAFTIQDYMQRNFPIYKREMESIVTAADQAAKWIEQTQTCYSTDSIFTDHTTVVITTNCEEGMAYTVRLYTRVAESETTYSFELFENEPSKRKAQQRLMEFATYINQ